MSVAQAPAIGWLSSLEGAMQQSLEAGKPIFLDLFSPACGGCQAMDTITYPEYGVQEFVRDHFTPVRLDVHHAAEAVRRYNQIWTPTLLVLNEEGVEVHRTVGYLPPEEFRAELSLGLGKYHLVRGAMQNAIVHLRETVTHFPETWAAPEAQYWLGVSRFRMEGEPQGLTAEWNVLLERWSESRWARSASFIRLAQG
jgi:Thioredoxin-like domain